MSKQLTPLIIGLPLIIAFITLLFIPYFQTNTQDFQSEILELSIDQVSLIEYSYEDVPLEAALNRNYSIQVYPDTISYVVDSYGDILNADSFQLDDKNFETIFTSLKDNGISRRNLESDELRDCVGGTRDKIKIKNVSNEIILDVSNYNCEGEVEGELAGDLDPFVNLLISYIPGFNVML